MICEFKGCLPQRQRTLKNRGCWFRGGLIVLTSFLGVLSWSETDIRAQPAPTVDNDAETNVVGERRLPTGQTIEPVGELLNFAGRPNSVAYSSQSNLVFVKNHRQLLIVAEDSWQILQSLDCPGGSSLTGLVIDASERVYLSNAGQAVHVFAPDSTSSGPPTYQLDHSIELPAGSFPCGMCLSPDAAQLFVCLSKANSVAVIDVASQTVQQTIEVGICPYEVAVVDRVAGKLMVSNLGGRRPSQGDSTATSAGSRVVVDERGVALASSLSIIDLATLSVQHELPARRHASAMLPLNGPAPSATLPLAIVTNTNDDSLTIIDSQSLETRSQRAKPVDELPFGSMPNSLCRSPDGQLLFVGLAGNNAVAVYRWPQTGNPLRDGLAAPLGLIPTGWFPTGLSCTASHLLIASLKGSGSRAAVRPAAEGRNSHDHFGMLQRVALADISDAAKLQQWSDSVIEQAAILPLARLEAADDTVAAQPIPEKLGQPSRFKHVIYVIKENRTYDQVFGDMPEGRGDPRLCTFPEQVTPNHHALARRFGLLDNYYCNGVLSADGHSWATEANVTPYLERAFGGFARSYTFGDDPLTYSSSGFLWDRVLDAGLTFRNYGEMDYAKPPAGMKYQEIWQAYERGEAIEFEQNIGIERLRRYSCRDYPGWNMVIPDVLRIDRFLQEFKEFEAQGTLPNLCLVYLPQDHLGGGVTSAAHMADNDLAVARLIEAVSHSAYWPNTLIIANEDDPQNGFDHIDGHRSICLVASAYSRPGVNHNFYNQTSVIRTILHVLGLPPLNQQDARSPLMRECFQSQPDLTPFVALPANYPLNQPPAPPAKQSAIERRWRGILATVPIERTGTKTVVDEDHLNRFIWHEMKGWETPYPSQFAGAHARGLKALRLELSLEPDAD